MTEEKKLTILTIRSDEIKQDAITKIQTQLNESLPKSHKAIIIVLGSNDALNVDTVTI
jgi:hypothetical protein